MVDEKKIKEAFDKVKDHISSLNVEINQIKEVLEKIKAKGNNEKKFSKWEDSAVPQEEFEPISTGNQGVLSKQINKQANEQANKQTNQMSKQTESVEIIKNNPITGLERTFKTLTKQEFHIFLLIYQLEDEGIAPVYEVIGTKLSLTLSCLRAHICSLIK